MTSVCWCVSSDEARSITAAAPLMASTETSNDESWSSDLSPRRLEHAHLSLPPEPSALLIGESS
jgi:hypothetical protein